MSDFQNEFNTERFRHVFQIIVPRREFGFVERTLREAAEQQGLEILLGKVGELHGVHGMDYRLGIALVDEAAYPHLIRNLDEQIYQRNLDDINYRHGASHPLSRYLEQLEHEGAATDAIRDDFAAKIEISRQEAVAEAWADWAQVRTQWEDAPQLLLPAATSSAQPSPVAESGPVIMVSSQATATPTLPTPSAPANSDPEDDKIKLEQRYSRDPSITRGMEPEYSDRLVERMRGRDDERGREIMERYERQIAERRREGIEHSHDKDDVLSFDL